MPQYSQTIDSGDSTNVKFADSRISWGSFTPEATASGKTSAILDTGMREVYYLNIISTAGLSSTAVRLNSTLPGRGTALGLTTDVRNANTFYWMAIGK